MVRQFLAVEKEISAGNVAPGYLVFGEELYFHRRLVTLLADRFEGGLESLDGEEVNWDLLADLVSQETFFGAKLWVVKSAHHLLETREEGRLAGISSGNCLVLSCPVKENPADEEFAKKWVKMGGLVVEAKEPSFADACDWVERKLVADGYKVRKDAVEGLVLLAGRSLEILEREVEKVELLIGSPEPGQLPRQVTVANVLACVSPDPVMDTFTLVDRIAGRNLPGALKEFDNAKTRGLSCSQLIAMLAHRLALIWRAKESGKRSTSSRDDLAQALGVHPFVAKKAAENTAKWSLPELARAMRLLCRVDEWVKTGRMDDLSAAEYVIYALSRTDYLPTVTPEEA